MNGIHRASSASTHHGKAALIKPLIYDDALITSLIPYGEADCIVRMLTKDHGRLAAFYKGGLATKKNRSAAQAAVFSHVGFVEHATKMPTIKSIDTDPMFNDLKDIKVFAFRAYVAELIEKLIPEGEACPQVFMLALETFEALQALGARSIILRAFELKLLDYCGYLPEIYADFAVQFFDPVHQRFLATKEEGAIPFSKDALHLAQAMLIAKVGSMAYEGNELMMIARIFQNRLKLMGLLPLKSVEFLRQLSGRKQT